MACAGSQYELTVGALKLLRRDDTYTASISIVAGQGADQSVYTVSQVVEGWGDIPEDEWPNYPGSVDVPEWSSGVKGPANLVPVVVFVGAGTNNYQGSWTVSSAGEFAYRRTFAANVGDAEDPIACQNAVTGSLGQDLGWCAGSLFSRPIPPGVNSFSASPREVFEFCFSQVEDTGICCSVSSGGNPTDPSTPPVDPEPPPPPIFPNKPGTPAVPRKNTMPIPGTATVLTYDCASTATGPACASQTDATRNPLNNMDANPPVSVRLEPSSVSVVAGRRAKIRVIAVFEDGQEADVTSLTTFNSPNDAIAESLGSGFIAGRAEGAAYVEFTWGDFSGRCEVTVSAVGCVDDDPWDVVLVIDQSLGSSFFPYQDFEAWNSATSTAPIRQLYWHPTTQTSIDLFDEVLAQAQCALSLRNAFDPDDTGADRLAVVLTGDGDPLTATTWSNSASSITFTGHFADVRLGQALQRAGTLLSSALVGSTKLVIVVTANGGNGCSPSALSAATTLKNSGALVAVVTPLAATATTYSACTYPQKAFAMMQSMATSGLFYGGVSVSELGNKLGEVLPDACAL